MGGTFNPIHLGHLLLAEWAKDMAKLDKVLFIPTGISYMKEGKSGTSAQPKETMELREIAEPTEPKETVEAGETMEPKQPSGKQRLAMVQLAIEGNPAFEASDIEIRRSGYTYTYETLEALVQAHPDRDYYFIIGADCLFTIEKWRKPERILELAQVIAAARGGQATDSLMEQMEEKRVELERTFSGNILLLRFPEMDISSTDIRTRIVKGQSIRYLVPEAVRRYIQKEQLYQ
jgi:nicotinate-nucleotide adenylyltransferase